jgi:hypothetical protein
MMLPGYYSRPQDNLTFYEDSFRPRVGELVFSHQHGSWREDYRGQLPALHDPNNGKDVAVADIGGTVVGYVAWRHPQGLDRPHPRYACQG